MISHVNLEKMWSLNSVLSETISLSHSGYCEHSYLTKPRGEKKFSDIFNEVFIDLQECSKTRELIQPWFYTDIKTKCGRLDTKKILTRVS